MAERRKGRSNAIITYELLDSFNVKLTTVSVQLNGLIKKLDADDHETERLETRLRAVEAAVLMLQTNRSSTRDLWVAIVAVLSLLLSSANTFTNVLWHHPGAAG